MTKINCIIIAALFLFRLTYAEEPEPGLLANVGFENKPVKSVFFFSGNWRNGVQFYDYNPTENIGLYTVHPSDSRHLGWSENPSFRDFAVQSMLDAGVNVINMSYWGLPGTDNWAYWSPMQTSTASHDQLFNAALEKEILIAPYIESFAPTDNHDGFFFADDFPGTIADPAPLLVTMIEDLVNRYLVNPANAHWPSKWAKVYDRNGMERYLVSIIHVASNQQPLTDQEFAAGFGRVAGTVFKNTGIQVGFALDILPPESYAPGIFKATPGSTGSWLAQQASVLAVQCFLPEIWTGMSDENDLITWKRDYHSSWINTGIPFIHDLTPGYDAHVVFPSSPIYGNTQSWRDLQDQAIADFGSRSFTFNAWNGYTEGMAGMPTLQYEDASYNWICSHYVDTSSIPPITMIGMRSTPENLRIFPNPVQGFAEVHLKDRGEQFISYELLNSEGILLKSRKVHYSDQSAPVHIHLEDFHPGIYILIVRTDRSTYAKKVLKL